MQQMFEHYHLFHKKDKKKNNNISIIIKIQAVIPVQ